MHFEPGSTGFDESDLRPLLDALAIDLDEVPGTVTIEGTPSVLASPLRSTAAGALALAVQGAAISALQQHRGQQSGDVVVHAGDVVFSLNPFVYFRRNGRLSKHMDQIAQRPSRGHFEGADGRYIAIAGILQKAHENVLRFFGAQNDRDEL